MDIKQYRSCNGCKGIIRGWCGGYDECTLGYKLKHKIHQFGFTIGYPGEPCPKPRTYRDYCDAPRKSCRKFGTSAYNDD